MSKAFLGFILIGFMLSSCGSKKEANQDNGYREGIYNVEIVQKNYETKSFELWANMMENREDTTWAKSIKVVFFGKEGDTSSVLYARKGWYCQKSGNVGAVGDVKIFATRGDSLFTDKLIYIDSSRLIIAPSHVIIFRNGERIEGRGLKSDVNFETVEIGGKVIGKKGD